MSEASPETPKESPSAKTRKEFASPAEVSVSARPKRRAGWWRLSLRTLLIAAPLAAVLLGMGIRWYLPRYLEARAVEEVERLGGTILRDGDNGFAVRVELPGKNITDEKLRQLLPHLKNLPKLRELVLVSNDVGDEGLLLLAELPQLQKVYVAGTLVTDAGVARLQELRGSLTIDRLSLHRKATALARREIYNHAILHLALAPGGRELLAGSGDGLLRVWDLETGRMVRSVQAHSDWTFAVEFHPSGQWLATGGGDNLVKFWSWPELAEIGRLAGHTDDVHAIGFTPDGMRLASAGDDCSVRIWDVASRRELHSLAGHEGSIPGLAMSPCGDFAATASRDGTVRLWSVKRGEGIGVVQGHRDDVMSVAFSPDGSELASASYDGTVRVWRTAAVALTVSEQDHAVSDTFPLSRDWLFAVAWSPSGEELVVTAGDGVRTIERQTGRVLWKTTEQKDVSHARWLSNSEVATASADSSVVILDAGRGTHLARLWASVR